MKKYSLVYWICIHLILFMLGVSTVVPIFDKRFSNESSVTPAELTTIADDWTLIQRLGNINVYYNSSSGQYQAFSSTDYINYYNASSGKYEPIDKNVVSKSLTISGRDYSYGVSTGVYESFWRSQFSDTKDRPIALVYNNYTLTYSPQDYILFEPHKGTVEGRVGNRVQSDAVVSNNLVNYSGAYEKVGTSGSFADLLFKYYPSFLKEEYLLTDKSYLQSRFSSQCNADEYSFVNLTFDSIIRMYNTTDLDNRTSGIIYGNQRIKFKDYGFSASGEVITNESIYFVDEFNNTVLYIPPLYAYDSNGNQLLLDKRLSMTDFSNLRVTILVPYSWLNETAVFPVVVDPSTSATLPGSAMNVDISAGQDWSNPSNACDDNDVYTDVDLSSEVTTSNCLYTYNYSFSSVINSSDIINGITVTVDRKASVANRFQDFLLYLMDSNGVKQGSNKASDTKWPVTETQASYGGVADNWSAGLDADDIRSTNFGVNLSCWYNYASGAAVAYVDCINITITYTLNVAPTIFVVSPTNQSTNVALKPTVKIMSNDTEGSNLTVTWQSNYTGSYTTYQVNNSVTANSTVYWNFTGANTSNATFWWRVYVNDSAANISGFYYFSTNDTWNWTDVDEDWLNQYQEYLLGSNDTDNDSDDDTYSDFEEYMEGTSPINGSDYPGSIPYTPPVSYTDLYDNYTFTKPTSSFGAPDGTYYGINITNFQNWSNNTARWILQSSKDGVSWANASQYQNVTYDWSNQSSVESHMSINLSNIPQPPGGYYWRYVLWFNTSFLNYTDDSSNYTVDMEFPYYDSTDTVNVTFNWSDLVDEIENELCVVSDSFSGIPGSYTLNFNIRTFEALDDAYLGEICGAYSICDDLDWDPTFGYNGGTSSTAIKSQNTEFALASWAVLNECGLVKNISFIPINTWGSNINLNCALLTWNSNSDAGVCLGVTETKLVTVSDIGKAITFNFSSPITLSSGTYFIGVAVVGNPSSSYNYILSQVFGGASVRKQSTAGVSWPAIGASFVESGTLNYRLAIYATYIAIHSWNGSLYNTTAFTKISKWNGSLYNLTIFKTVSNWNGSLYNSSSEHLLSNWNGTLFNITSSTLINNWNGSLYNTSHVVILNVWNGTLYNVSNSRLLSTWNGSLYNISTSIIVNSINGTVFDASNFISLSNWNGTIYNSSEKQWNGCAAINGTLYNLSSLQKVESCNGSLYNISNIIYVSKWNGSLYNVSHVVLLSNWNGSLYNTSNVRVVSSWNGSLYNLTSLSTFSTWNGSLYNTSHTILFNILNGTLYNISHLIIQEKWNGTIYNLSIGVFTTKETLNGSLYNSSNVIVLSNWNGSLYNTSNKIVLAILNGTLYNLTLQRTVESLNGSLYNVSASINIEAWNGTLFNRTYFVVSNNFNGSLYNTSILSEKDIFNGSIYNLSVFSILNSWNGSLRNISFGAFSIYDNRNGSLFNTTHLTMADYFNGSLYNISGRTYLSNINGSLYNQTSLIFFVWNGSLYNLSLINYESFFNGSLYNTSNEIDINIWNGSIFNLTLLTSMYSLYGILYNRSILSSINGTLYNVSSITWTWNGTIYNSSGIWYLIESINGTISHNDLSIGVTCFAVNGYIECTACKQQGYLEDYKWDVKDSDGVLIGSTDWVDWDGNSPITFAMSSYKEEWFNIFIYARSSIESISNSTSLSSNYNIPISIPEEPDPNTIPYKPIDISELPEAGEHEKGTTEVLGYKVDNLILITIVVIVFFFVIRSYLRRRKRFEEK